MSPLKALLPFLLVVGVAAHAAQVPVASPVDPRIRTIVYNPREVVTITGQPGYQMVVEFGPGERIENVSIGDAQAWQATPNRKADLLFLKPIDSIASTNMTVVTNLRRYNFELIVQPAKTRSNQTFDIRFIFPNEELAAKPSAAADPSVSDALPPESWNFAYSYTGDKANLPARVFDDGRFTYFQWPAGVDTPAVFAVGADGKESLVNHIVKGRYFVVEQLAGQFVLRSGAQVTQVFNDAMRTAEPGAAAPRPRDAKPRKRGLFG
ncbi:MAG: P-type conjugative transfer protein VirB9 [Sphingomonadales bacterium]|jgi:type IV secretion system protein VirB9